MIIKQYDTGGAGGAVGEITEGSGRQRLASRRNGREAGSKNYTTSQVARRWSVSPLTVIRLIEQGDLNGLKIRGTYRISHGSIARYESRVSF